MKATHTASAEKSDAGVGCGEILAPSAASTPKSDAQVGAGLLAMNILRIPKVPTKPRSARDSRKRRDTSRTARLELTLEMPSQRPPVEAESAGEPDEPERGVAEVDFYI